MKDEKIEALIKAHWFATVVYLNYTVPVEGEDGKPVRKERDALDTVQQTQLEMAINLRNTIKPILEASYVGNA